MSMSRADLAAGLKLLWGDAAAYWTLPADADYVRHLAAALHGFGSAFPRRVAATLTLLAGTGDYALPADFVGLFALERGRQERNRWRPWDAQWPGRLPTAQVVTVAGVQTLRVSPTPAVGDITSLGSAFPYVYQAQHTIGELAADTTVPESQRESLLLHGMAAGLQELAVRNVLKPIQLHRGMGSVPANSTPQAALDAVRRSLGVAA